MFSTLDANLGYSQIEKGDEDVDKTAFVTHTVYSTIFGCRMGSTMPLQRSRG